MTEQWFEYLEREAEEERREERKKREEWFKEHKAALKRCRCEDAEFAICTPVAMTDEGKEMLRKNMEWIGEFVCASCGGVSDEKPDTYAHITGETVLRRLVELGVLT